MAICNDMEALKKGLAERINRTHVWQALHEAQGNRLEAAWWICRRLLLKTEYVKILCE